MATQEVQCTNILFQPTRPNTQRRPAPNSATNVEELNASQELKAQDAFSTLVAKPSTPNIKLKNMGLLTNDSIAMSASALSSSVNFTSSLSGVANTQILDDLSGLLDGNQMSDAMVSRWGEFVAQVGTEKDALVDINAFVQAVLREDYMENTKELHFYAQKVRYFNEVKKAIRDQLTDMREVLGQYAGKDESTALEPPYTHHEILTGFYGSTTIQTGESAQMAGSGIASLNPPNPDKNDTVTVELGNGWSIQINPNKKGATKDIKIFDESGQLITHISGKSHVDNGGDGHDWHFGDDSTFILPDGTKLCLNSKRTSKKSDDEDAWVCHGIDIISGNDHVGMGLDPDKGGKGKKKYRSAQITQDGLAWDKNHADASNDKNAGIFTWSAEHHEWAKQEGKEFNVVQDESWKSYKKSGDVTTTGQAVHVNSDVTLAIKGDPKICATKGELDTAIQAMEEKLNSVGDDAQLANVDLQNMLQKQQQTLQMMSNISKMLHDTAMAVIRKIGG